jgi:glycosyltransferase involved in cell wall biosynthesis
MSARVAVIIPTYNHARYLAGALDSAFGQSSPPHEVIVVDDGSSDDPAKVVHAYPAARLIRQDNQGLAAARNTGWRTSVSERLVFLDADDRLKPDAIARNLALFAAHPHCGMVYGAYCDVFTDTGEERNVAVREPGPDAFASFLRGNCIGMHATVMYSRAALEALGGFDPSLRACEDYDLYLRLAQRYPIACHPAVIAEYVRHDANMSRNAGMMLNAALTVLRKQRGAAGQRPEWRAAMAEGEAEWTRFYADQWRQSLLQASSPAKIAHAWRQAVVIFRLSPGAIPAALMRVNPVRRLRRALRRRASRPRGG